MPITSHTPDTPLCDRYLSSNGITGIAVWRDADNPRLFRLASTTDPAGTEGWASHSLALTLRTCKEQGRKIAARYSLAFHGLTA